MERSKARVRSSRAVMTQSTSRTGRLEEVGVVVVSVKEGRDCHHSLVSSERLASSFLSKQGMMARCQILEGGMLSFLLRTDLRNVPVNA